MIRFTFASLLLLGCYNPLPQSGVQQCGPKGECEAGYYCAADSHCYKNGDKPKMDASVQSDMAMPCTADTCKAASKVCDPDTHGCVDCLQDGDCPLGKVCQQKACVDGCNDMHGCPSGMCVNGMCSVCKANGDCANDPNGNKLCDVASGKCVACLMTSDCGAGQFCDPGDHACHMGCDTDAQCTTDAGNANMKCCNHVCYDLNSSNGHCGDCGTDCGNLTCCGGSCSDTMNGDIMNCGGCGIACQGQRALWACMNASCVVTGCSPNFNDCDKMAVNGCESNSTSDANNCGMCGVKCTAPNATVSCVNGSCATCACNAGFADCNNDCKKDGCEIFTDGDANNCGGCGNVCNLAHAMSGCVGGKCVITGCLAGFSNCNNIDSDGCEAATSSDVNNCGGCNMKCNGIPNGTPSCVNSVCTPVCSAGFRDCNGIYADGCEANLNTDVANCGGCGRACSGANVAAKTCAAGLCTSTCAAGFGNCIRPVAPGADDGCETNTTNNNSNCGACGNVCGMNTTCQNSMCGAVGVKVLLVHGNMPANYYTDVQTNLKNTGAFATVDVFDASAQSGVTPTLAQLQAYTVILVYTDGGGFKDPVALGNVVAQYYDGGGRVVIDTFANASIPITGTFGTVANGYMLIDPTGQEQPMDTLGAKLEPNSPLLVGVNSLSMPAAYRSTGGVVNGGIVVAQFASGKPLIVRGVIKGRNRCDLNFYMPPSFWTGDGTTIVKNCLLFQ